MRMAGLGNPPGIPQAVQVAMGANPWDANFGRKLILLKSLEPQGTASTSLEPQLVYFHPPFPYHCDLRSTLLSLIAG